MAVILVVEDDELNQELVTRFLRRAGHQVFLAVDGMTAVTAALLRIPDLIIMDLGLPGLDGWEAAKRIRATPETAHIPIIALTAHTLAENVRKAKDVGFNAYETKPVIYARLLKKIATFC
jgi:two-component system cell cycle response regulator DivK